MSWLILLAILLPVLLLIIVPLLTPLETTDQNDLNDIKRKLAAIEEELGQERIGNEAANIARTQLERRALSILDRQKNRNLPKTWTPALVAIVFVGCSIAIYAAIGAPNFEKYVVYAEDLERSGLNDIPPEQLAEMLAARLAEDENPPPMGYQILGRTLMILGEYEEAFKAFERASDLSGDDPSFRAEYERARKYVESLSE